MASSSPLAAWRTPLPERAVESSAARRRPAVHAPQTHAPRGTRPAARARSRAGLSRARLGARGLGVADEAAAAPAAAAARVPAASINRPARACVPESGRPPAPAPARATTQQGSGRREPTRSPPRARHARTGAPPAPAAWPYHLISVRRPARERREGPTYTVRLSMGFGVRFDFLGSVSDWKVSGSKTVALAWRGRKGLATRRAWWWGAGPLARPTRGRGRSWGLGRAARGRAST